MENGTDHTEYLNFVFGQLYVIKHLCAATIALQPYRKLILQLGNNVLDEAIKENASEPRKNGIKDILVVVEEMVNSAELAVLAQKQGPDTRYH